VNAGDPPPCAPPDFEPRRPGLTLPEGSCDCHAHVIGPAARYPMSAQRIYTPPDCTAASYRAMLSVVGISRAVLVQPSIYGSDNRLLLDVLGQADPALWRGVAVLAGDEDEAQLLALHQAGVRGARVNLVDRADRQAGLPLKALQALAQRIAPWGWHLELLVHVDEAGPELMALGDLPVPVVLGHLGYLTVGRGVDDEGFMTLLQLMQARRAWVKLTGPYRLTRAALPYPEVDEMAAALRETAPDRLVWGTDWPHVMLRGPMPNDAEIVDLLSRWLPDQAQRRQVLVDNPCVLYGFEPPLSG
jgi:predicted TIM-barrel fold metal-dependent hydrolase